MTIIVCPRCHKKVMVYPGRLGNKAPHDCQPPGTKREDLPRRLGHREPANSVYFGRTSTAPSGSNRADS